MAEGGYWVTDFHAVFSGTATFRAGKWRETSTTVHGAGVIAFAEAGPLVLTEHEAEPDEVKPAVTTRSLPAGRHAVFVAVDVDLLAVMIRTGSGKVLGWAPALFEGQGRPAPPWLPKLTIRSSRVVLSSALAPSENPFADVERGTCMVDECSLGIDAGDTRALEAWWGLDAAGDIQAFVLDVSGGRLREFERHQPTPSDPRYVINSCPRITTERASLVRRLEHLVAANLLELDVEPTAVVEAFLAQPDGNLRRWLAEDADGVSEAFFTD